MVIAEPAKNTAISMEEAGKLNAYWRAANYLSVGQIYLYDNPLLRRPLTPADIKPMLLGHWGTTPGQNFIYAHLNRVIRKYDLNMIYVSGPGHGGPAVVANTYLEGTYSEIYPNVSRDEAGLKRLFTQFSFPGGIPSHASPETPGSIHEGGELGYSLSHSFGAVFDNPDLIVACVVGDGEAETGPLATAWHSNKFLNPISDGAVLPILHLNGYKIANPTILARISHEELDQLLRGYGWTPYYVEGREPDSMHQAMAAALDSAVSEIKRIQHGASVNESTIRPLWPMIVLKSPKGWTGPKTIDGVQIEGTFHSHQVPLSDPASNPNHLKLLEEWLRSYRPEELFDDDGNLIPELAELAPKGSRRMGANPHANGGLLLRDLRMPDYRDYGVDVPAPGVRGEGDTHVLGRFLRDVVKMNDESRNFRVFGPDETASNRLEALFDVTNRQWEAAVQANDEFLAPAGRVMEMLSEHQCEGWLEGYLLTGRHGLFNCYEAFIHIVDFMFNQHAKWLKVTLKLPWRHKIASLNYLLASHVWRQDHNGFTHQDPGFLDHVVNKKAEVVRVYLPPDANCLLSVMDHCLRSRHYVNVVVAGKHPAPQWLSMDAAVKHCSEGIGIWQWAGNDNGAAPDVVMACCGDVPTLETLAAVSIIREHLPDLKVRVVNVVDLMKLQPQSEHPHGLTDVDFDLLFTQDKPVIFAFHAYPWLIHRLTYRRANHNNIHVRGYKEEGTITTPFDMTVLNDMDRFHLVMDVIDRVPKARACGVYLKQQLQDKLIEHRQYIEKHGQDMPEIRNWKWPHDMSQTILVLDPGSSSLKFGLFAFEGAEDGSEDSHQTCADPMLLASGTMDRLGSPDAKLTLELRGKPPQSDNIDACSVPAGMEIVLQWLQHTHAPGSDSVAGIGCRVVHGGDKFNGPVRVIPKVVEAIRELAPLAPLHNPVAADLLDICMRNLPGIPLFAVFDTTFHRTLPDVARTYALPFELCEGYGLHRFGFHGIAHHFVSSLLVEKINRAGKESRCITCHLGSGASICAVRNGQSIDTSMGMTPLEGLVMGTRSGDVDPGLLMYLMQTVGMSPAELDKLLEHKSGLLGVSGLSGDVRDLEAAAARGDARAALALELFAYRAAKTIGAYTAALEGLDALAFSGGIGEHSASVRARICRRLACLGIRLDDKLNKSVKPGEPICVSDAASPVRVWVIPADEDLQIAREVWSELAVVASNV